MTPSSGQTVQVAEGLLKAMSAASRTIRLYPETSPLPLQAVRNFHGLLTEALAERPFITIGVSREGFSVQGEAFGREHEGLRSFATDLFAQQVSSIIFRTGVNEREIMEFLKFLTLDPLLVREQGGLTTLLLEQHVANLVVTELELKVVPEEFEGGATGELVMHMVDDVSHSAVQAVEQFFVSLSSSVPEMVEWLKSVTPPAGGSAQGPAEDLLEAVRQLGASIGTSTELPQEQAMYFRNIAEGILALEEPLRSQVVLERMIPASGASQLFAKILSQLSEAEIAELLAGSSENGVGGLADVVGDLSFLGERREQVLSLLEEMLREKGHPTDEVGRLKAAGAGQPEDMAARAMSEETVEVLMAVSEYSDEDLRCIEAANEACQDESIAASAIRIHLALLAGAEDEQSYAQTLDATPELLAGLVESGQVERAAEALDWATTHARSVLKMWPSVQDHLRALLEAAGSRDLVHTVVEFIRVHGAERDIRAATRYVTLIPDASIEPIVDALAEENVAANRKRLCAVLSETGRKAVHVLGTKLTDPRWYLVRNVVSVLGMMRDPAALPFLKDSLSHKDGRVRAEAVRAVGMIRDPSTAPWLVERLSDPDQTIRLAAARWLGRMHSPEAVAALCQLVETRTRSDFEVVKVAIQALGQIGDEVARPALERVASRRALFRRGRVKELKALAGDALRSLVESSEEGGAQ